MTAVDFSIDPETPGLFARDDYYEVLARLRRDAPVHPYAPNAWTLARYADVREVSRDPGRFRSGGGVLMHDPLRSGGRINGSILHMDPPQHGPWRRVVSRRFTPRAIGGLEASVRDVARDVLARVPRGEEVDFVEAVSSPFPVLVIADLLGIGDGDRADFRRWSDAMIEAPDNPGAHLDEIAELFQFLSAHVRDRRVTPRDDIVSVLVTADVDGEPMSTADAVGYCLALLVAGNETTRHLLSGSALALFEHPEQRRLLAGDPALIPSAVEECLRWVTPIQVFGRTVTRDTELGGRAMAEGDWVVMLYASANRDESVFGPTAARFEVTRPVDTTHVAFGFGEHLCLGAALARLEMRVMLEELLTRQPAYEVVGAPAWARSTLVRGMSSLPVRFV
jgi:cytochrome P450